MRIRAIIKDSANKKLESLAQRRYGNTDEAIDRVISDVLEWQLDRWDRYGLDIRDWFWLKVAYFGPMAWLRAIAWGKLIEPYFD